MKQYIFILLVLLSAFAQPSMAKNPYKGEMSVQFHKSLLSKDMLTIGASIKLDSLKLDRNQIVILTPKLISAEDGNVITFDNITVSGRRRARIITRANHFGQYGPDTSAEDFHILKRRESIGEIPLKYDMELMEWMKSAQFQIHERTYGCYNCEKSQTYPDGSKLKIYTTDIWPPYTPTFNHSYIIPPIEPLKIRGETYAARLQFVVDRSELLRNFASNAKILDEVDSLVNYISTNDLLKLRRITVKGYASPEGPTQHNIQLSQDRAKALAHYLRGRHNYHYADMPISSEGFGEDWDGLRKEVAASALADKQRIMDIIDNIYDTDQRKRTLEALNGGRTYRFLLDYYYPPLRRNEFVFEYEVRNFTTEESEKLMWERPELLSLNEMFNVALRYEPGSDKFRQVFDIAERLFPESRIARFNSATARLEDGDFKNALDIFAGSEEPESLNNAGIVYWHNGDYGRAMEMFQRSAQAGNAQAAGNLAELKKWQGE